MVCRWLRSVIAHAHTPHLMMITPQQAERGMHNVKSNELSFSCAEGPPTQSRALHQRALFSDRERENIPISGRCRTFRGSANFCFLLQIVRRFFHDPVPARVDPRNGQNASAQHRIALIKLNKTMANRKEFYIIIPRLCESLNN